MTPSLIPGEGKPLGSLSIPELNARQEALLDAIAADAPEEFRARTRELLSGAIERGTSLEVAKGGKYEWLASDLNATVAEKRRRQVPAEPEGEMLRVLVGMVSSFTESSIRSTVLRRPDDNGVPVLLLPMSATPEDLTAGLSAARHSFKAQGRSPKLEERVESQGSADLKPSPSAAKVLEWIRSRIGQSPISQRLEGYGTVRLVPVATPVQER